MKKTILFCIVLACAGARLQAQSFCSTPGTAPDLLQQISPANRLAPSSNYVIMVFVHVMKRSNGTGGQSPAAVTQAVNFLVTDFQAQNICISLLGQDEILSDSYYN